MATAAYRRRMTSTATTTPGDASPSATTELLELDRDECLRLLAATNFGRLVVTIADRTPVIRPINYLFDESSQSVVFRTALGSKFGALLRAKQAVFEIDGIDEADQTGWSVIASGVTEEIVSRSEIERVTAAGLESWAPGHKLLWMRIRTFTVSGRRIVLS
jgi:nitroimidazol reductase NimA-like FMN-containing flavoprotein (pyridoxamine 5'-phosphate oxidase superfamily)